MSRLDRHPSLWFALGAVLISAAHMRWGVGILAFVAPIAMLRGLRLGGSRTLFGVATFVGWTLCVAKIITAPLPLMMAPVFAAPIALCLGLPYLLWRRVRPSLPGAQAALFFSAAMVLGETFQHWFTDFASWGGAAYTQLDDLALLQLASITGSAGVSFVVYMVAATIEGIWAGTIGTRIGAAVAALWVALHVGGTARIEGFDGAEDTVLVAAVGTDATFRGLPLPSREEMAAVDAGLERRTRAAAAAGAELVVWTEAAAMVRPEDESVWVDHNEALAAELGIELVVGYVVPVSTDPFLYENKYAWLTPQGETDHTYFKNNPVFGEPAVAGDGPAPRRRTRFGEVSGAICYDYDYPRMGLDRAGVDLVALPSSDWRGIDPVHTRMASVRAIEAGHSLLRSTRFGLSAGVDPTGRIVGAQSAFDGGDAVLLVHLPRSGVTTMYGLFGDWFVAMAGALVAWGLLSAGLARYAAHHVRARPSHLEPSPGIGV